MRKIIQIARSGYFLNALCNDGTVLRQNGDNTGWEILDYKVPHPTKVVKGKVVQQVVPSNTEQCFELLWSIKRKGARGKAWDKFEALAMGATADEVASLTSILRNDIQATMPEFGFDALHLSAYLHQERWVK